MGKRVRGADRFSVGGEDGLSIVKKGGIPSETEPTQDADLGECAFVGLQRWG